MIITCPRCLTQYSVDSNLLDAGGTTVRCSNCQHSWVEPASAPVDAAAAPTVPEPESGVEPPATRPAAAESERDEAAEAAATDSTVPAPDPEPAPVSAPEPQQLDAGDFDLALADEDEGEAGQPDPAAADRADDKAERPPDEAAAAPPPPAPPVPKTFDTKTAALAASMDLPESAAPTPRGSKAIVASAIAVSVLAVVVGILVQARHTIVAAVPGVAPVYASVGLAAQTVGHGLELVDVSSRRDEQTGAGAIIVEGVVAAVAAGTHAVPPIRVALFDADDEELHALVVPPDRAALAHGDRLHFEARIDAPPIQAHNIRVTFDTGEPK